MILFLEDYDEHLWELKLLLRIQEQKSFVHKRQGNAIIDAFILIIIITIGWSKAAHIFYSTSSLK